MTQLMQEEEYQGSLNLSLWREVLRHARPYWPHLRLLLVMAILLAGLDVSFTLISKQVIDALTSGRTDRAWLNWVLVYAGVGVLFAGMVAGFILVAGRISTGTSFLIRQAAFDRLQALSFSYFDKHQVGWLVTRLTSDCDRLSRILSWGLLDIVWGSFFLSLIAGVLLWLDWALALVVLAVVPPLAWASVVFQRRLLSTSRQVRKTNSNLTAGYNESIMGVRTTKALVRGEENLREFRQVTGEMYACSVRNAILSSVYLPTVLAIGSIGMGLALWRGGLDAVGNPARLGELYAFITYAGLFFLPIQEMARALAEMQQGQAAAERVLGLLATEPEVADSPEVAARIEQYRNVADRRPGQAEDGYDEAIRTVEFRDVSFSYDGRTRVIDGLNLTAQMGQTIALAGPTGGGKTTLVSLLCRFYEPTEGQILLDGVDYRDRGLHWLQSNLGIVLQQPQLFSGTVAENIRYGRLDATDEEVAEAARLAGADTFIRRMEDGYATEVGEGGNRLSTGQRQLVSFARAVLADPQIFVMDEATSSVDTETEQVIQRGLSRVLEGRLSFVIAHRLSTIKAADRILVIDGGRVVEDGTHRELIARGGRYHELYTGQFTRVRSEEVLSSLHKSP
jgi:ATP-binding cassette subfamily B protein